MILDKIKNSVLFKSTFIYGLSSAINGAIPFLILPFLTRYLTPADYGIVTVFTTVMTFFNVLIGININAAVFNKYFFSKETPEFDFSKYLSSCLSLLLISSGAILVLTLLFSQFISEITHLNLSWILLAAVSSMLQNITFIVLALYQTQNKAKSYALLLATQAFLNVLSSILFIYFFKLDWTGRTAGILTSIYSIGLISLFLLNKTYKIRLNLDTNNFKSILNFGLPLVPHTIGGIFVSLADRFLITNMINLSEAGLYQAGLQVSMIILFFTEAFNKAYAPWLYQTLQKKSEELNLNVVKFTYAYFVFILAVAFCISAVPEDLFVWLIGEKFRNAKVYIFWSSLAFAFNGMYLMVCNYIFYSEKNKYLAYITLPVGLINILLSFLLIDRIGTTGAAISMTISYFLMFILTWYRSAKLVKMPWNLKKSQNDV